jgi:hypothetical protein
MKIKKFILFHVCLSFSRYHFDREQCLIVNFRVKFDVFVERKIQNSLNLRSFYKMMCCRHNDSDLQL